MATPVAVPPEDLQSLMRAGQDVTDQITRAWIAMIGTPPAPMPPPPHAHVSPRRSSPPRGNAKVQEIQQRYAEQIGALWTGALARRGGSPAVSVAGPAQGDTRFEGTAWKKD